MQTYIGQIQMYVGQKQIYIGQRQIFIGKYKQLLDIYKYIFCSGLRRSITLSGWRWRSLSGNRCPWISLKGEILESSIRKMHDMVSSIGIVTWLCLQPTWKRTRQRVLNRASFSGWTSGSLFYIICSVFLTYILILSCMLSRSHIFSYLVKCCHILTKQRTLCLTRHQV